MLGISVLLVTKYEIRAGQSNWVEVVEQWETPRTMGNPRTPRNGIYIFCNTRNGITLRQ